MATILEPSLDRGPGPESSDRSFGFVFAVVFILVGCWPLLHGDAPRRWALGLGSAFAFAAIIHPVILRPLNRGWLAFGRLIHRVVSPVVMGVIFFLCVTPIGWIMRLLGKDMLSLKIRRDLPSYWVVRAPSPPDSTSMKNQF